MRPPPRMIPVLIDTAKTLQGEPTTALHGQDRRGHRGREDNSGPRPISAGTGRRSARGCTSFTGGAVCVDAFSCRRRKPAELPRLLDDIRSIADGQSQADPKFQTDRLFTRISAAEVRRQLIATKGYTDAELPTQQTINKKLNLLGFRLTKVAKSRPQKKSSRPTPSSSN